MLVPGVDVGKSMKANIVEDFTNNISSEIYNLEEITELHAVIVERILSLLTLSRSAGFQVHEFDVYCM